MEKCKVEEGAVAQSPKKPNYFPRTKFLKMRFVKSFHKIGTDSGMYLWYGLLGLMGATYFIGNPVSAIALIVTPFAITAHSFVALLIMYE